MRTPLFSSLRSRLILLVLLAVLPGLVLAIYSAIEQGRREVREIEQTNLSYLRLAASGQAQMVDSARVLMTTLSQIAAIREADPTDCNVVLTNVLQASPLYQGISVIDPQGNVICSSIVLTQPINVAQREFFIRALDKKEFVVGGFQRGIASDRPNLTFGYPVLNERGEVERVISAGIDVDKLNASIGALKLPEGYVIDILDRDGTFIVRWPDSHNFIGETSSDHPIIQRILSESRDGREHIAEMTDIDGARRLYAFSSVPGTPDNDLFVNVGISTDQVAANVNRTLLRNLITLSLFALVAAGVAWVLGDALIVRRTRGVINTAVRLREGDLSARTGLPHDATELGELATSFDEMAMALQQHETERNLALAALKTEEEEQRTLAEVGAAAVRSLDYSESLKDIAAVVCSRFSDICIVGTLGQDEIVEQSVCVHKSPERQAALQSVIDHYFPALSLNTNSRFVQRLRNGEAILFPSLSDDLLEWPTPVEQQPNTQMSPALALDALGSAIVLPMKQRGRVLGVLTLIRERESPPFTQADLELAQQIADRAGQTMDSARLYQESQQLNVDLEQRVQKRTAQLQLSNAKLLTSQKELRILSQRQNKVIEEERRRIAREVHDQVGQALTSIKMDLSAAQRRISPDQSPALEKIKSASRLIDETIQITRRISSELRPGVLDAFGLEAAVEWQLRDFENRSGAICALESNVDENVLSQDVSITTFRILQEALSNVARHAAATRVRVTLATADGSLMMRVADNGKGIADESAISSSLGVLGMRERALTLDGDVVLSGAPGQGATLTLSIPLRGAADSDLDTNRPGDPKRDMQRDAERDMQRDAERDLKRDVDRDARRDAERDTPKDAELRGDGQGI